MTIGIYALYWTEPDLIYIGQSKEIEIRLYEHLRLLKVGKHCNYKICNTYAKYGEPETRIIEECALEDLDRKEIFWMQEFDSLNSGLNIVAGGITNGKYTEHGAAKFTKEQLVEACRLLLNTNNRLTDISELTDISVPVLSSLANKSAHLLIADEYPEIWTALGKVNRSINRVRSTNSGKKLISPSGEILPVIVIANFAKDHNLSSSKVSAVLNETRHSHKGWKLFKQTESNLCQA